MPDKTRVRFAPSPTGLVHIGSLRTALYDYLFARNTGGDFILKIEDTDQKRFVEGAVENLIKSLGWCGLNWDEGVFQTAEIKDDKIPVCASKNYKNIFEVGEYGPYIQSEKLEIYKKYAEQLIADGHAYYCFCGPERLEELRNRQAAEKKPPMYDRHCLSLSKEEIKNNLAEGKTFVIRLKVPRDETIEFEDMVRGKVKFETNLVDDQVLLKSDGFPTYHLANVIDDHDMKITHVIRGEEWLSSVPKHLLLYRYFGWEIPKFAHLPLLLNIDRSKLSKRQGDVAVEDYIRKGYLKEAIINFVALLGWNPGEGATQEIFSLEELVNKFDFAHVHKGGAVFDIKKLDWINAQWIKKLSVDELYERALPYYEKFLEMLPSSPVPLPSTGEGGKEEYLKKVLAVERDRLLKLSEVGENNKFFFSEIEYGKELLRWKGLEDDKIRESLDAAAKILENITHENWTRENLEKELMAQAEKYSNADGKPDRGRLLWPLRVALTGQQKSPSPFEAAWVLGKDESLKRIQGALGKL
jgi:glutamyl-tRNA synthetase